MSKTDFDAGDLVLVKEVKDYSTLKEGDIISYISQNTENYGEVVTHKIRRITTDVSGEPGFITYGTTTIVFGGLDADPVKRQEQYGAAASMHSCITLLHEGQIYDENGFIADANGNTELLKSQVEELCKFANSKGIKFNYPKTRNFDVIQAVKDAEKAAQEAAEKAAAEKAAQEVVERATTEQKNATQEKTDTQSEKTGTQSGTQTETQSEIPTDTSRRIDSDLVICIFRLLCF